MSAPGLVKSMVMIGGAQGGNIIMSILRVKVLALLLGPAGVGLLGVYNNLREAASITAGLGLTTSGVRELASTKGEDAALSRVRRVLFWALALQGGLAAAVVWISREALALWLLGDTVHATSIGFVGVAVFIFMLSASQMVLLQGMRQIADMARATIIGAAAGSVAGIVGVWVLGMQGLIWFILAPPLATMLVATFYTRKLPRPATAPMGAADIFRTWRGMVRLGVAFMLGGLLTTASLLLVRGYLTRELGLDAAGQFAASWAISMTYVGFLLNAMGADYLPRLTEVIHDQKASTALMNDQLQLGLALGGPFLLALIAVAPWFISLLYSADFDGTVRLLQWQSIGNIFKLASWAFGFAIVAAGRSGLFLFSQVLFNVIFIGLIWFGLPAFGIEITAVAFLIAYGVGLIWNTFLVHYLHGFRFQRLSLGLLTMHTVLAALVMVIAVKAPVLGAVTGVILAGITGLVAGHVVTAKVNAEGRLARKLIRFYAAIGWPIRGVS